MKPVAIRGDGTRVVGPPGLPSPAGTEGLELPRISAAPGSPTTELDGSLAYSPAGIVVAVGGLWLPIGGGGSTIINAPRHVYSQASPSLSWNVVHNLGFFPAVEVFNTAGELVDVEYRHLSANQYLVTPVTPLAGFAIAN